VVKFSQVRISAPAAAGNEVGRDAGIHSSECPLVVNALYTNRCRIRKQSARLRCFASMCSCPFTSCWPGILPHDRTFASPGHLPVKTTIANICILCMHDFPVCSFNPAFRGCQNPINGLCFVCSLVMVRVKVIGSAFRVTVRAVIRGGGGNVLYSYCHWCVTAVGWISDWDWVCGGLGCHGSAGLCKLGGSL